jgi:hypothetical protein
MLPISSITGIILIAAFRHSTFFFFFFGLSESKIAKIEIDILMEILKLFGGEIARSLAYKHLE